MSPLDAQKQWELQCKLMKFWQTCQVIRKILTLFEELFTVFAMCA